MAQFVTYTMPIDRPEGNIIYRSFIVLKDGDLMRFTDFSKYARSSRNNVTKVTHDNELFCKMICQFLNYLYFRHRNKNGTIGIGSLNKVTVEQIKLFLNLYAQGMLSDDDSKRTEATIDMMIADVLDFMINYLEDKASTCSLSTDDLFKEINVRDRQTGKTHKKKIPIFDVDKDPVISEPLLRDVPNAAFELIFSYIYQYHTELLGPIFLQAFCGLRPSEALNVRRVDSILGPGIFFSYRGNRLTKIRLDLKAEKRLRDGSGKQPKIKKENERFVPPFFLEPFKQAYDEYLKYVNTVGHDEKYGPLCVNKQGTAMSTQTYRQSFQRVIQEEIVPIFLQSDNVELVDYGTQVREHGIAPHLFRHYFTVQLVLNGVTDAAQIAFYRGDSSLESATTYLTRKTEFQKLYRKVAHDAFDVLSGMAARMK